MTPQVPNQFVMSDVKGHVDLTSINTLACEISSSETRELVAGNAVKLVDVAGGIPVVKGVDFDTDAIFGFINFSVKDKTTKLGSRREVSIFGNIMYMEASAAIARGSAVAVVVSGQKVVVASGTQTIIGIAIDKATASGDLIRVLIQTPIVSSSGGSGGTGSIWYSGSGVPSSGTGINGDYYLDTDSGDVYYKSAGSWSLIMNIKGPQGDAGAPGAKGDQGDPGEKGDTGDAGPQGIPGPKGDTGDTGAQGDPGPKGDTGDTGPKGDQGDPGAKGDTGDTGPKGDQGDPGAKGDQGDPGAKGDKGDTGDTGPQGPAGADGADATNIYREFSGTGWKFSLIAKGLSADVNNITALFTGGNTITIGAVAGTAQLVEATMHYDPSINGTSSFNCVYPELNGKTALNGTNFPALFHFNASGVIQTMTSISVANSSGTVTVAKSGLSVNAEAYFKIVF